MVTESVLCRCAAGVPSLWRGQGTLWILGGKAVTGCVIKCTLCVQSLGAEGGGGFRCSRLRDGCSYVCQFGRTM
jgi:hypothetical protein